MQNYPRFLDLYHDGHATSDEINVFIDEWHDNLNLHVSLHVHLGMTWGEYVTWGSSRRLPTEAEHHEVPQVDYVFIGPDKTPLRVHGPIRCRPTCPVHWPSDHPQADWPHGWLAELGIMTRMCSHGRHHPDPDDQQVRLHPDLAQHPCDGCCKPTIDGQVSAALVQLDGTSESAVSLLTGVPRAELNQYGGLPNSEQVP